MNCCRSNRPKKIEIDWILHFYVYFTYLKLLLVCWYKKVVPFTVIYIGAKCKGIKEEVELSKQENQAYNARMNTFFTAHLMYNNIEERNKVEICFVVNFVVPYNPEVANKNCFFSFQKIQKKRNSKKIFSWEKNAWFFLKK